MKVTKKIVSIFTCEKCGTGYPTPGEAADCEKRRIEKCVFKPGDRVRARGKRTCYNGTEYVMRGKIQEHSSVECPDEDYENRHLGGKESRLNSHVRVYTVKFICPVCKDSKVSMFYAPELEKLNTR